jgi:hypothetical protein
MFFENQLNAREEVVRMDSRVWHLDSSHGGKNLRLSGGSFGDAFCG